MVFYGVLVYLVVFYSQIGARIPALEAMRPEFLTGGMVLAGLAFRWFTDRRPAEVANPLAMPTVMLFAVMLLTIPISYWPGHSVDTMIQVFKYFALYLMIVGTVDDENKLRAFIWTYVAMVLLITGEPLLGLVTGSATVDTHRGYGRLMGVTGLWAHPNSLGGFAAGNLGLLYYLWRGEPSRAGRLVLLGTAGACAGAVLFTGSRTAYVGALGALAIVWWLNGRRIRDVIAVVLLLAAVWTVLPAEYKAQFLTLKQIDEVVEGGENVDSSMAERWEIIQDAYEIFLEHPILGVGVDAFPTARGEKFGRWLHTHNLYLQVLAELGLIGGIAFAFLIARILGTLKRTRALLAAHPGASPWLRELAAGVAAFLWTRLIVGTFGMDLYENYWWLAAGLAIVLLRLAVRTGHAAPAEAVDGVPVEAVSTAGPALAPAGAGEIRRLQAASDRRAAG